MPGRMLTSIVSRSPPVSVQARPSAMPMRLTRSTAMSMKCGVPRNFERLAGVTVTTPRRAPEALRFAVLRHTLAISRSRFRTPASRV